MRYEPLEVVLKFLKRHKDVTCAPIEEGDQTESYTLQIQCQDSSSLYFAIRPNEPTYHQLSENHGKTKKLSADANGEAIGCEGIIDFRLGNGDKAWIWRDSDLKLSELGSYDQWDYFAFRIKRGWYRNDIMSRGEFDIEKGKCSVADIGGSFPKTNR